MWNVSTVGGNGRNKPVAEAEAAGVKVPVEFAVLPPIVLDGISTDWVLRPGNDPLNHYAQLQL